MIFAAGFASGWISCLAFMALLAFVVVYVCVTGQFPRLRWPAQDGPGEE